MKETIVSVIIVLVILIIILLLWNWQWGLCVTEGHDFWYCVWHIL